MLDLSNFVELRDAAAILTMYQAGLRLATVGGGYGKNAQGAFLLVELMINNAGNKSESIDSTQFKLLHDGVEYNSDGGAAIYANDDNNLFLTSINLGNRITTVMPFDIPESVANSDGLVVQVGEGMFSSKIGDYRMEVES